MITIRHIEIYNKYGRDSNLVTRSATPEEKPIIGYKDWSTIENLIQDLLLIKKGLAAKSYIKMTEEKLKENCDSEETIQALKQMA